MHLVQIATSVARTGSLNHLNTRVPEEEAKQLTTNIATGTNNRYAQGHRHTPRYARPLPTATTWSMIRAGIFTPVVSIELRNSIV